MDAAMWNHRWAREGRSSLLLRSVEEIYRCRPTRAEKRFNVFSTLVDIRSRFMIKIVQNTIEDVPQFITFTSTPRAEIFCV